MNTIGTNLLPRSGSDAHAEYAGRIESPRSRMAERLPHWLQPFLTRLTGMPAPGERRENGSAMAILLHALVRLASGLAMSAYGIQAPDAFGWVSYGAGLLLTSSAMGQFQVVIFHHCAHGTVFRLAKTNLLVGRLLSATLLFKFFDLYRQEHLQHHRANVLLTADDEFAGFLFRVMRLCPGERKARLWGRTVLSLLSPMFHVRFLAVRVMSTVARRKHGYNLLLEAYWTFLICGGWYLGLLLDIVLIWMLPLTVLLQVATVLRILCEHRFPDPSRIQKRDKAFVCDATTGVFPGREPPATRANTAVGLYDWACWWLDILFVQTTIRLFVLVGDAPCHDFHHRHPGSRNWTSAVYARQHDREMGCPNYPSDYTDVWGLFAAIDATLASLSAHRNA